MYFAFDKDMNIERPETEYNALNICAPQIYVLKPYSSNMVFGARVWRRQFGLVYIR